MISPTSNFLTFKSATAAVWNSVSGVKKFSKSSPSSILSLVIKWSKSTNSTGTLSSVSANQVNLCLVFLKSPSKCNLTSTAETCSPSLVNLVTMALPQSIKVNSSESSKESASSWSMTMFFLFWATDNGDLDWLDNSGVSWGNWIDDLLVQGPDDGPVQVDNVSGRPLSNDEVLQPFNGHTSSSDTSDGWESWIVPVGDMALVDEPLQLTLGQQSSDKVHSGEIPDVHFSQVQVDQEPLVLRVTVTVLDGSQSMGDTFDGIDNWDTEIVGWVHLPGGASSVVRSQVASVDDWVSHGFVWVVDGHLGTQTVLQPFFGTVLHLLGEDLQVLFDGTFSSGRGDTVHSLVSHLLLDGVVTVGLALLDQLDGQVVHFLEVVGGESGLVALDTQQSQVLNDRVLELKLFLGWVGVVESDDQFPVVLVGKVLVQDSSLGVTNVQVSRRFRWETGHDLTINSVLQVDVEVGLVGFLLLTRGSLVGLGLLTHFSNGFGE
ncbi:hypothetical protein WICPIJ_004741 [Wickerhamomyces pijperi]|uniref:Uncharacterized protein n=1 Tax=Wickerhamomyces pijperi TaxID=599730 RepID=A0A9P8TMH3_WICPI|nr:hypothetical protein WICPIJ_004741 [Wickerhamomyces pijperi]